VVEERARGSWRRNREEGRDEEEVGDGESRSDRKRGEEKGGRERGSLRRVDARRKGEESERLRWRAECERTERERLPNIERSRRALIVEMRFDCPDSIILEDHTMSE